MEKKLKRTKRRWSSIGKFITPRNKKLDILTFETTPLPVRLRMESATMDQLGWSEYLTQTPSAARKVPSLLGSPAYSNIDWFNSANHPANVVLGGGRHQRLTWRPPGTRPDSRLSITGGEGFSQAQGGGIPTRVIAHRFNRPVEGTVTEKTGQHLERIYGLTDTHPWSQSLVVAIAERMGVSE